MTFHRYLPSHRGRPTNTRYVAPRIVVSCADGVRHPDLGDEPRVVLDLRSDTGDGDVDAWERSGHPRCVLHHRRINIDDLPHVFHASKGTADEVVEWYVAMRQKWPDVLLVINCFSGRNRSASAAYVILRAAYGLGHADALDRVRTRDELDVDENAPHPMLVEDIETWCNARERT